MQSRLDSDILEELKKWHSCCKATRKQFQKRTPYLHLFTLHVATHNCACFARCVPLAFATALCIFSVHFACSAPIEFAPCRLLSCGARTNTSLIRVSPVGFPTRCTDLIDFPNAERPMQIPAWFGVRGDHVAGLKIGLLQPETLLTDTRPSFC